MAMIDKIEQVIYNAKRCADGFSIPCCPACLVAQIDENLGGDDDAGIRQEN